MAIVECVAQMECEKEKKRETEKMLPSALG